MTARVLFVASIGRTLKGFVSPLARALREHGYETVAASGAMEDMPAFNRTHELPPFRRSGPVAVLRALRTLDDVVRYEKPSLLHLHTPPALVLGRLVARRHNIPCIAVVHGTFLEPLGRRAVIYAGVEAVIARTATATVAVNDDDARFYRRVTRANSVLVAPVGGMGIDIQRIRSAISSPLRTAPFPSILTVGRLTPDKNLDLLIDAFQAFRTTYPSATLTFLGSTVAGEPPWSPPTGPEYVHIPWVDEPYPLIAGADMLVATSRREGFAMAVAEATLLGTRVVAVANRGTRQIARIAPGNLRTVDADAGDVAQAMRVGLSQADHSSSARALLEWSTTSAVSFHAALVERVLSDASVDPAWHG